VAQVGSYHPCPSQKRILELTEATGWAIVCRMLVFTGYHGTDEYGERQICEDGFHDSPAESWLGPGVYFFESQSGFNGMEAAEWWVSVCKKYPRWVILRASIVANKVFDTFGSSGDRMAFRRIKQGFLKKHIESGGREDEFNLKPVFLFLNRKFEVIRCLVDAARLDKFVNYIVGYPQIQICVTKSGCIRDIRREKTGGQKNG